MVKKYLEQDDPEWEVAFFTTIQPSMSESIGRTNPDLVNKVFSNIDEDSILEVFNTCCNKMSVSICLSENGSYILARSSECFDKGQFEKVFQKALSRRLAFEISEENISP